MIPKMFEPITERSERAVDIGCSTTDKRDEELAVLCSLDETEPSERQDPDPVVEQDDDEYREYDRESFFCDSATASHLVGERLSSFIEHLE
jgi:hypothetical protein